MTLDNKSTATIDETATYIVCFGCDEAVRILDQSPCPACQRCALCGQKLKSADAKCDCAYVDDAEYVSKLAAKHAIEPADIPREMRRMEIRQEYKKQKMILGQVLSGILFLVAGIYFRPAIQQFNWKVIGIASAATVIVSVVVTATLEAVYYGLEDRQLDAEQFETDAWSNS